MSSQNIHFDLKSLLEEAVKKNDYQKVFAIINKIIPESSTDSEAVNGIFFKDVKQIVKSKEELENILLSTKVLFEKKEEIIEFFDMLLKYGLRENAISYFEDLITQIDDIEIIDEFNTLLTK